jgi:hypothetical protein
MINEIRGDLPAFVSARTPFGLRRKCLMNNKRLGLCVKYFDFQEASNGKWYCWFYQPMSHNDLNLNEVENDATENDRS